MKLLILLFLGLATGLHAAHMRVTVTDSTSQAITNCRVVVTPYGGGMTNATNFVTTLPKTNTTDSAGQVTYSNIVAGPYAMTIYSTRFGTTYLLNVTNQTTNVFDATECNPSVTNANSLVPYSMAAADARFPNKSSPTVTNATIHGTLTSTNLTTQINAIVTGITTNLQLVISGASTNTLYITNGLIKAISSP